MNIWQQLKKPIFVLAPMEDVTDTVFRQIVLECGKPDLFFTEFTSTEGLFSKGRESAMKRLLYQPNEKPLIAQIWGSKPELFYKSAQLVRELGFDGVDINMGCPVKNVYKSGSCSALIGKPGLANEIIQATKEGAKKIPVSVKTRLGIKDIQTESWIGNILEQNIDALTVHLRTVKEASKVPAHWGEMKKVVSLRDKISPQTLILGNGDISSLEMGREKVKEYGIDGVMIGRGIFHNPWLFAEKSIETIPQAERIRMMIKHIDMFEEVWGKSKPFEPLRRFFKIYINGFDGASEVRTKLVQTTNKDDVLKILQEYNLLNTN